MIVKIMMVIGKNKISFYLSWRLLSFLCKICYSSNIHFIFYIFRCVEANLCGGPEILNEIFTTATDIRNEDQSNQQDKQQEILTEIFITEDESM